MGNVAANFGNNANPGQKEHHGVLQKYSKNDMLNFIQNQHIEGIQQQCKMYQKKDNEILFSIPVRKNEYQAQQQFNQEIKLSFIDRIKLQHPNLISCVGIDTIQIQEQNDSSEQENGNLLNLMYEYNTFSLEALISERLDSNRLFPEDDLLNLAKSILNILNYLQRQNIPHSDIHPSSIFFNTSGNNFAIYDRDFLCGRCIGMRLAEGGKKFSYLSPEQITLMRSGSNVFTSNDMIYKSDIFCFGMTLLEAASLRLSQECYDENYSILAPVINERLQFIQNYYSSQFCSYLSLMLEYDVRKRLDPVSLWNKLQRDGSFLFPTHVQNNIIASQQQQQNNHIMNNSMINQNKCQPLFTIEQQNSLSNQITPLQRQQQQQQNMRTQASSQYPRNHQNPQKQQIDEICQTNENYINSSGIQKNCQQDSDNKKFGKTDQQLIVQESAHFAQPVGTNQIGVNNQNNQQKIQLIHGNSFQNYPIQQQNQQQFIQNENQLKNSQIGQQNSIQHNGMNTVQKQGIINNQQQKLINQNEQIQQFNQQAQYQQQVSSQLVQQHQYPQYQQQFQQQQLVIQQQQLQQQQQQLQQQQLSQQQSNQQYKQSMQKNMNSQNHNLQFQHNTQININHLEPNAQHKYMTSHQQLDYTPIKDQNLSYNQNEQLTNEKIIQFRQKDIQQQQQSPHALQQQQIGLIQQSQNKYSHKINENNQILNRESRSASSYSVSQERLYPQEINKTSASFQYSPQFEQANQIEKSYQNENAESVINNIYQKQRQDNEKSLQFTQNRKHSKSLFNGVTDNNSQLEFNPSQILKNLQDQQQIIHAQFKQNFSDEQYQINQAAVNQQSQKQMFNNSQLNSIGQVYYQQNQQYNQSNFETEDMNMIAPENDPNTSTSMILQSQNFLKFKHPKSNQSTAHQNISQEFDQKMNLSQIGKQEQQNTPYSHQLQKQSQIISKPNIQAIQPSVSPLRENNGKNITSHALYQKQQNQLSDQNIQKEYSIQASNKNHYLQPSSNQRIFSQRSKSFIQPSSNLSSAFNSPSVLPKPEVDENVNQQQLQSQQQQLIRQQEQYGQSLNRQQVSSSINPANQQKYIYYNGGQIIGQQQGISSDPQIITQNVYQGSNSQLNTMNSGLTQNLINQPQVVQSSIQKSGIQQVNIQQTQFTIQKPLNYIQQKPEQNYQVVESQNPASLNFEQEQQFSNHSDNQQVQNQLISPKCIKIENGDQLQASSEQQQRSIVQQHVYSQLPQTFYLSPNTQINTNDNSESQNSSSQIFKSQNKNILGCNTSYKNIINNSLSNQQPQSSAVLDSSQYDMQSNLVDTSIQNNKKSGIYQNSYLSNFESPYSILVRDEGIQAQRAQQQNILKNKISKNISYDNQMINNSNVSQNQSQNKIQDIVIDNNQQNQSPHAQPNQSALKLSLLLQNQQQLSSKVLSSAKIQDSQIQQISSFQPNIDLNERVKQVIARSQAIRKTFE